MFDYLINHAIRNVWCTPNQDKQMIVQPAKLTPYGGVWNTVKILWRTEVLPEQNVRFHVYQIGQLHPALMGLFESDNVWTTFAEACNRENLIVDIYGNNGLEYPRTQVWYMCTQDKDLIVAIKDQRSIGIKLSEEPIFLRVYSNAYFGSSQSDPLNDYVKVNGKTIKNTDEIISLQDEIATLSNLPGAVYSFINGFKVSSIDMITTKVGDVVEYVYDSSVYKVIDLTVGSLETFISTLDNKHKYLVHYTEQENNRIDYHDDIDFFLINKDTQDRHKGVYYHRNESDAIRMITHKDYSIVTPYIAGYLNDTTGWTDIDKLVIRLHIRKSGYDRNLVLENNRIEELYKLPEEKLIDAMVGVNSIVSNWQVAELEKSAYAKIMRSNASEINRILVEDAYGYNSISKLIGDTPTYTHSFSGTQIIQLPYALINKSTAYEYNVDGVLLDFFIHPLGSDYVAYMDNTILIDMIVGTGLMLLDEYYGNVLIPIDYSLEYRMYLCQINGGVPDDNWIDVTNSDKYSILNNKLIWNIDHTREYGMVRSNKSFLAYNLELSDINGTLEFSLNQHVLQNGIELAQVMTVPLGELDLFLNGHSLIQDLDYIVNFPKIVILNKAYLQNPLTKKQRITIRFTGFCNEDLSINKSNDHGFIEHELLSHNNRFDIRDDKVLRIVVGGKLQTRNQLKFAENDPGVLVPNAQNGVPYLIRDIVVPLRGLGYSSTYACRAKSQIIDKRISDYMTLWMPEINYGTPNAIESLYEVFSPFCCKIIYDLKSGLIHDQRLKEQYSDSDVMDICKPYEYLLAFDPTQVGLEPDLNYVAVHPHNLSTVIEIDIYAYKFITRVVRLYLHDNVNISHFLSISAF